MSYGVRRQREPNHKGILEEVLELLICMWPDCHSSVTVKAVHNALIVNAVSGFSAYMADKAHASPNLQPWKGEPTALILVHCKSPGLSLQVRTCPGEYLEPRSYAAKANDAAR